MDLINAISNAYCKAHDRKWNKIYILLDIHGTIAESNYDNKKIVFYRHAITALRICKFKEIRIIIWSSCYPKDIKKYVRMLKRQGVRVDAVNRSMEKNNRTGDFRKKPYFSIIIDDKAGFDHNDWHRVSAIFADERRRLIYVH